MKRLDKILLWVQSALALVLGLFLLILCLVPRLSWLEQTPVRLLVGALTLVSMGCVFWLHGRRIARKHAEAALVTDGENGNAYVSLSVICDMARRIALECEGIKTCKARAVNTGDGVDLELSLNLYAGVAVAPLAGMLQERLKTRIFEMTGIRIGKVSILVETAKEGKAPGQQSQLPDRVK